MSRRCALTLFLMPVIASAQEFGTKKDVLTGAAAASPGVGFGPLLQMMIALGIVLGLLKVVLPKVAAKFGKRIVTGLNSPINIEESAAFAGGNLYVVSVRGKTLLLSASQAGVNCLADLTTPGPVKDEPTFGEILEVQQATPAPAMALIEAPDVEPVEDDSVQAALDRLSRLGV
jgi:hypothetical protein